MNNVINNMIGDVKIVGDILIPMVIGIISGYCSSLLVVSYSFNKRRKIKRISAISLVEKIYRLLMAFYKLIPSDTKKISEVNKDELIREKSQIQDCILKLEILDALNEDEYRNTVYDLQINHLFNKWGQEDTEIDTIDVVCNRDRIQQVAHRFQDLAISLHKEETQFLLKESKIESFWRFVKNSWQKLF